MKYLVLYEKNNGELIYRYRNSKPQYEVGSITSMGWKLVDIRKLYNGSAITDTDYSGILEKKLKYQEFISKLDLKTFIEILILVYILKSFL